MSFSKSVKSLSQLSKAIWHRVVQLVKNSSSPYLSGSKLRKAHIIGFMSLIGASLGLLGSQALGIAGAGTAVPVSDVTVNASDAHTTTPSFNQTESSNPSTGGNQPTVNTNVKVDAQAGVKVNVNGQDIPVPQNGTVHKEMPGASSNSNVSVTVVNNSSTKNNNTSSTHVYTHSSSSSTSYTFVNNQSSGGNN